LFVTFKHTKIVWKKLEDKHGADDVGKKKYRVDEWLHFQITDDKPIMEHFHVYKNLCAEVLSENMKMCKILQANVLIKEFVLSWSDHRNHYPKQQNKFSNKIKKLKRLCYVRGKSGHKVY